jgi:hypothetical protein
MRRKLKATKKPHQIHVRLSFENWFYLLNYISEEEDRGLWITMTRAVNALISQLRTGHAETNETDFRRRRRDLGDLHYKRRAKAQKPLAEDEVKWCAKCTVERVFEDRDTCFTCTAIDLVAEEMSIKKPDPDEIE